MIGRLRGVLAEKSPPWVLIDVLGVGYELQLSMNSFYVLPALEAEVQLYTHFIVREDHHALYGFYTQEERSLFQDFIKISGIGPKAALALLSGLSISALKTAILNEEIGLLKKIPGIGPKTAQRIIVEMQDRKKKWASPATEAFSEISLIEREHNPMQQTIQALIALGYKSKEAESAVEKIKDKGLSCEDMIKRALQGLAKV